MQITEDNRPRCKKCEKPAITYLYDMWLCGDCLTNYLEKLKEEKRKLILEE
ncbi:MAG: hypothetical protein ACTSUC_09855 [Promethearchaeota archaeon]